MVPEIRAGHFVVAHEVGWLCGVRDEPAAPDVHDCLLVAGRTDYGETVKVDSTLDDVGGVLFFSVYDDCVAPEKDGFHEVVLVFFALNTVILSVFYSIIMNKA